MGIHERREGEFEHEVSGECEGRETRRGTVTGAGLGHRRCREGDCHTTENASKRGL